MTKVDGAVIFCPNSSTFAVFVYRQGPSGPADPSFLALSRSLKFTARRHKIHKDSLCLSTIDISRACGVPEQPYVKETVDVLVPAPAPAKTR